MKNDEVANVNDKENSMKNCDNSNVKRTAIYLRTSLRGTEGERELASQATTCRRMVAVEGEVVALFADRSQGQTSDRSGLDALLEAARQGQVAGVIVSDKTRLGRDGQEVDSVLGQLAEHRVLVREGTHGV